MTVKLMHYWTVIPSENNAYGDFIIKEFIPGINGLGMQTVAGWSVIVGSYSEVILEAVSQDLDQMESALKSEKYRHLKSDLLNFIKNYKTKILVPLKKDQDYSVDYGADTIKFNQVWDVITREKDDFKKYRQFVKNEYYPVLEKIGVTIASEWEVLIGDGPRTICEGRVNDVGSLISGLQSARFRQVKDKLKTHVENYESRILSFHIRRQSDGSSESYQIVDD
jgi:ASC-1-like (ASCH) protein